jgi:isocitrate dehydrogenase
MMLEHLGWQEAADSIVRAMGATIQQKKVTYDLARQMDCLTLVLPLVIRMYWWEVDIQ